MNIKKRGLGTDLAKMLSQAAVKPTEEHLHKVSVNQLQRGQYQPRLEFKQEKLQELADSIKSQGLLQPIVVRKLNNGFYEILAGERRWRAAQLAGLNEVSVIVKIINDEAALAIALIENIQRENLNVVEEALALQRLLDEFGLTHEQVAKSVGRSRTAVSNLLRLLQLPEEIKNYLSKGELEMGHARALLSLSAFQQLKLAEQIIDKGLSVRQVEELVKRSHGDVAIKSKKNKTKPSVDIVHLEQELADKLGTKVNLQHRSNGRGRLVIEYHSLDILDGILRHIH